MGGMKLEAAIGSWAFMLAIAAWLLVEGLLDKSVFDVLLSTVVACCALYKGAVMPRSPPGAAGLTQRLFCFGIGALCVASATAGFVQIITFASSPESSWFVLAFAFCVLPFLGFSGLALALIGLSSGALSGKVLRYIFRNPTPGETRLW